MVLYRQHIFIDLLTDFIKAIEFTYAPDIAVQLQCEALAVNIPVEVQKPGFNGGDGNIVIRGTEAQFCGNTASRTAAEPLGKEKEEEG